MRFLTAIQLILLVFAIGCIKTEAQKEKELTHLRELALWTARRSVSKELHARGPNVKFPKVDLEKAVERIGENEYKVTSSILTKNGFGLIEETHFICKVIHKPNEKNMNDEWSVERIEFFINKK